MSKTNLTCNVCGKNEAIGVFASATGPVSYAYCLECGREGREPYGALVSMVASCGSSLDCISIGYKNLVLGQLEFHDKTVEKFNADVKKSIDDMIAYFDKQAKEDCHYEEKLINTDKNELKENEF